MHFIPQLMVIAHLKVLELRTVAHLEDHAVQGFK